MKIDFKKLARVHKEGGIPLEQALEIARMSANGQDIGKISALTELVYNSTADKSKASEIADWVNKTAGWFFARDIDTELGLKEPSAKGNRRAVIKRLMDANIIEGYPHTHGKYRKVVTEVEVMNWQEADTRNTVPLGFPFSIEKYVKIYPRAIIIVTGSKDEFKTGFLYNFIAMNMYHAKIHLFNSESGDEQMRSRFDNLDIEIPNPAPFNVFRRHDNFADAIFPNDVNVIDYMDAGNETFRIGDKIDKIFRKLDKGVAVIGLQKPHGRELAYGKEYTEWRAMLYLVLGRKGENFFIKIRSAKQPAQEGVSPKNMKWKFRVEDGVNIRDAQRTTEDF